MLLVLSNFFHTIKAKIMRCPKCGYISFDHLETCKKCHKYLGNTTAEINGTTYDAAPPLFLTIAAPEEQADPLAAQQTEEEETYSMFSDKTIFEMQEVSEFDKENSENVQEQEPEPERYEIEFAGFDDGSEIEEENAAAMPANEEFALEEEDPAEGIQPSLPSMDFGDLDISDLAPPAAEQAGPIHFESPPALTDLEPVAVLSPPAPQPSVSNNQVSLEDLNTSGLDLEAPARLVSGSAASKRFFPSVKTGTALDKFDIDLGNLFTDNKK